MLYPLSERRSCDGDTGTDGGDNNGDGSDEDDDDGSDDDDVNKT